jgi:glycosyltransferase involved in cell wall biosynthesis
LVLRVALVCGRYEPEQDGVADYVRQLADHLPAFGVDPLVFSAEAGLRAVASRIRARRPDVVHVQFAPAAYRFSPAVGLMPLLLRGRPLVATVHEYGWWSWPSWVPGRLWRVVERRGWWDRETLVLVPASRGLVVTNDAHAVALAERFAGRVHPVTIPIGPNIPEGRHNRTAARRAVRTELRLPIDAPLLVFFGFVHPVKGLRYLLEALPALRSEWPALHLVVVGGFTSLALPGADAAAFEAEIRGQIDALRLRPATTVTGYCPAPEVSRYLAAADLAVFPFTQGATSKSGSLLAAMAHRLPVVATAGDDPVLLDGVNVVLVQPSRDAAALREGVRRVLRNCALGERVAAGGAAVAAGRSWPKIAEEHALLYRRLVGTADQ